MRDPSVRRASIVPGSLAATRFTLGELFGLLTLVSCCAIVMMQVNVWLGWTLLGTAIAFRTATVDFSPAGHWANLFAIVLGVASLGLIVMQSIGF